MTVFKRNYVLALAALPILASCSLPLTFKAVTAGIAASSYGVFSRPDVNLKEKNYAAADFMAVKMKGYVSADDIILALPLKEADNVGISSPLGENISEGVGLRLSDLGYHVRLHKVDTDNADAGLYPKPQNSENTDFILKGSYRHGRKYMNIFLILVDAKSTKIIANFDYSMPLSKEIRDLSETPTRISRITE